MKAAYAALGIPAVVKPFLAEMDLALGAATAAVSRAGASSLAELAALRLPVLLVPYPTAADNHQFFNARIYTLSGAARLLEQKASTPEKVAGILVELVEDDAARAKMSAALGVWHAPQSAGQIAANILRASFQSADLLWNEADTSYLTRGMAGGQKICLSRMTMLEATSIADELAGCVSAATVLRRDEPMAKHTTLRVGGPADVYAE